MAGKGNKNGKVPASSLKEAVMMLRQEIGVLNREEVPAGWYTVEELSREFDWTIEGMRRRLRSMGLPMKVFKMRINNCVYGVQFFYVEG